MKNLGAMARHDHEWGETSSMMTSNTDLYVVHSFGNHPVEIQRAAMRSLARRDTPVMRRFQMRQIGIAITLAVTGWGAIFSGATLLLG